MKQKAAALLATLLLFVQPSHAHATGKQMWQTQCIDTMKISRDRAREWAHKPDLQTLINNEMDTIKSIGANCVAIDTPYDNDFLPVLHFWVQSAHNHGLLVWFRGNFSRWEGWFDYPKGMNANDLFQKTKTFINGNPDLFQDGDIFTPAPEAENGGPFNQVEPQAYATYRKFLLSEYTTAKDAFDTIDKRVETNWLSMNGGLARRMLNRQTVDGLGGLVTIDHYIKTPQEMAEYITYFRKSFQASVVVGEFGAPIPDLNGTMNEHEQAHFVRLLLTAIYKNKNTVSGVNYWDLLDGSTALLNPDSTPREVVQTVKDFYSPVVITGIIKNTLGEPISHVRVGSSDGVYSEQTDSSGEYSLTIPAHYATAVTFTQNTYIPVTKNISGKNNETVHASIVMLQKNPAILYKLRLELKKLLSKFHG